MEPMTRAGKPNHSAVGLTAWQNPEVYPLRIPVPIPPHDVLLSFFDLEPDLQQNPFAGLVPDNRAGLDALRIGRLENVLYQSPERFRSDAPSPFRHRDPVPALHHFVAAGPVGPGATEDALGFILAGNPEGIGPSGRVIRECGL